MDKDGLPMAGGSAGGGLAPLLHGDFGIVVVFQQRLELGHGLADLRVFVGWGFAKGVALQPH